MNRTLLALVVLTGLSLSGCSPYQNQFDCPYSTGVGCASLSKVNTLIDAKQIDLGDSEEKSQPQRKVQIFYRPGTMSRLVTVPAAREL